MQKLIDIISLYFFIKVVSRRKKITLKFKLPRVNIKIFKIGVPERFWEEISEIAISTVFSVHSKYL